MKKPRGNKTSKAQRAERQSRALQLMKEGRSQTEIAAELQVSRSTFWRDLQSIEAHYVAGSTEDVKQFKEAQYRALLKIEEATAKGTIEPDVANALTRIRDSVARLLGLNAESRSLVAHVSTTVDDPRTLGRYRRFFYETRHLSDEDLEKVYAFCRPLNVRTPAPLISPPVDSPLWHDEDEPKQLAEGEPDEV